MDYAAAFEQTLVDDDWSRLTPFFSENASYEVRGGPMACNISGREAIVAMRDEYDDKEMASVGAWMVAHGEGLDGSYV